MLNLYSSKTYRKDVNDCCININEYTKLKNKSILIVGASGLIGSFIIDTLLNLNDLFKLDINIYAMGRSISKLKKRFNGVDQLRLTFIEQDIVLPISESLGPVDYLIHAASNANPKLFSDDPIGTIMSNVVGTERLLDWASVHGVSKFVYISSGEVYGKLSEKDMPFSEGNVGLVNQMDPRSCYPVAKRTAENICVAFYRQHGLKTMIVRPSHVFGPNFTSSDNRVSAQFFNDVVKGEDIIMKSKGSQLRSYCYIADCVSGIISVLLNGKPGNAYNCTNTKNVVSLVEFAKMIAFAAGKHVDLDLPNQKSNMDSPISLAVLDDSKLRGLGWHPVINLQTGVRHSLLILNEILE